MDEDELKRDGSIYICSETPTIVDIFDVIYTVAMLNHTISRTIDAIEPPLSRKVGDHKAVTLTKRLHPTSLHEQHIPPGICFGHFNLGPQLTVLFGLISAATDGCACGFQLDGIIGGGIYRSGMR
jgi:hypothetical protein